MSGTKIYSDGWVATVFVSPPHDGFYPVYCRTSGDTQEKALEAAQYVLEAFALGREAFIRVKPEAHSDTDFDTKETYHRGFVRFSYKLEPGCWHYPDPNPFVGSLGFAAA